MAPSELWDSPERIDKYFKLARNVAVGGAGLSIVLWTLWFPILAVPATVVTSTAVLFMLFLWFRKDDLSRGAPLR